MISSGHGVFMQVMSSRNNNLQFVKAMWSAGNVKVSCLLLLCLRHPILEVCEFRFWQFCDRGCHFSMDRHENPNRVKIN